MSVFIAICVVDTVALISQFEYMVQRSLIDYHRINWSLLHYDAICKLLKWLIASSQVCSAYFVLLFTLERYISVRFPLKRAIICTKRRITIAIVGIVVVACLMTTYDLYYYEVDKRGKAYRYDFCINK